MNSSLANIVLIPLFADFRKRYPDIQLLLGVSDRPIDLISDGVDCVIRAGALADSSLVARSKLPSHCRRATSTGPMPAKTFVAHHSKKVFNMHTEAAPIRPPSGPSSEARTAGGGSD